MVFLYITEIGSQDSFLCLPHSQGIFVQNRNFAKGTRTLPFYWDFIEEQCLLHNLRRQGRSSLFLSKTPLCNHVNKSKQQCFKICARYKAYKDNFGGAFNQAPDHVHEIMIVKCNRNVSPYYTNNCTCSRYHHHQLFTTILSRRKRFSIGAESPKTCLSISFMIYSEGPGDQQHQQPVYSIMKCILLSFTIRINE